MKYEIINGLLVPENELIKETVTKTDTEYRVQNTDYRIIGEAIFEDISYILPPTNEVDNSEFLLILGKQNKPNLKMIITTVGNDKIIGNDIQGKYLYITKLYDYYILKAVAPLGIYLILSNPFEEKN